jgi:hypothetical protein
MTADDDDDLTTPGHHWTLQPQYKPADGLRYHALSNNNQHRNVCGKRLPPHPSLLGSTPSRDLWRDAQTWGELVCLRCARRLAEELTP